MNSCTEPKAMERGGHKDIPEENWLGLTTDMVSEKTLTFFANKEQTEMEKGEGSWQSFEKQ